MMSNTHPFGAPRCLMMILATLVAVPAAWGSPPAHIPVQGVVSDVSGVAIDGELPVTFTLYADAPGSVMVWTETKTVAFDNGFFAEVLGEIEALPLSVFRDEHETYLGIAINSDSEMPLIALSPVPYAAYAEYADDAATIEGYGPSDFMAAEAMIPFAQLTGVPADLLDGDDGISFSITGGSGLELSAGELRLLSGCAAGDVLKNTVSGWACGVDENGSGGASISDVSLAGNTLSIIEGGTSYSIDLSGIQDGVDDADNNPNNETNTGLSLSGTTLLLTDANGTLSLSLASLQDGVDDADNNPNNETNTGLSLSGTTLLLTDADGTLSLNLAPLQDGVNDADSDPSNETNTSLSLSGTTLLLTDADGTLSLNLAPLQDGVNDADSDPNNETNTSLALSGNTLSVTDSSGTLNADLSPLTTRLAFEEGMVAVVTATTGWLGDPVVATVANGQTVQITASGAFGSLLVGGAAELDIYPCWRLQGDTGTPTKIGLGIFNLRAPQDSRMTFSVNGVVTMGSAGSFEFGMCGDDDGNGKWNNNEWSYTSIIIVP